MRDYMRRYLEFVEGTDSWRDADLKFMDFQLGESLLEYGVDPELFARIIVDVTLKIREIVQKHHPIMCPDNVHNGPGHELLSELAILVAHNSIMAAIATREARGKIPVWQMPVPPREPDSDDPA